MNGPRDHNPVRRRTILRAALITGAAAVTACSSPSDQPEPERGQASPGNKARGKVLLVYFSRPGENYRYGGRTTLTVGNTEVLAGKIRDLIGCDVHRIEPADPYPEGYDATVKRNVVEQDTDARPAIKNPLPDIGAYDTVLLGSPIWNVRAPMIMTTFTEQLDFSGKVVVPFTTHAMSGLGTTARDYAKSCRGATFADGLAVQGEEVGEADEAVETWLRQLSLIAS
ncbi:Flavodoxin [Lentzea waywayandensis]|uniref:Flavodoxin n=1 Tax=Lentzea waywayandensis TaxID=84724 RepID=A0A1I6FDU6_9PSEU|nr:flavodoxin [Lentzea waywayandensis]SFR28033.1 Flavodoxin [Lentzea waywayandensis]